MIAVFGEIGENFLAPRRRAENIVTNPPYNAAEGFVRSGLSQSGKKFALLLRLAFLEGSNRANTIFSKAPPSRVWVFVATLDNLCIPAVWGKFIA